MVIWRSASCASCASYFVAGGGHRTTKGCRPRTSRDPSRRARARHLARRHTRSADGTRRHTPSRASPVRPRERKSEQGRRRLLEKTKVLRARTGHPLFRVYRRVPSLPPRGAYPSATNYATDVPARGADTSVAATIQTEGVGHMAEGKMTADQKGHLSKRPAEPAPSIGKDIKLPGGNVISQGRPPILTMNPPNGLKAMAGSDWPEFNDVLLKSTIGTVANTDPDAVPQRVAAVSAALAAFRPVNEIEGMIASQCVALHFAALECLRRAMLPGQPFEVASKLRKDAANMARAMTDMLDAMDRKRGRGPQVVRVERVVVHEGGQAIVGNVQGRGTAAAKPVPPLAIGQDAPSFTMDDLVGKQPELVGREGV
jgi:hypothetical protein